MLSRRNVRIKAMQTLYALNREVSNVSEVAEKDYYRKTEEAYKLYLYNLYLIHKIATYARRDAAIQAGKYIRDEENDIVSEKFLANSVIVALEGNTEYLKLTNRYNLSALVPTELLRKMYREFTDGADFKAYVQLEEPTDDDHRAILLKLFKFLMSNEYLVDHLEDMFPNLYDDESLMGGAVKRSIKSLPDNPEFYKEHELDKEVVRDFGGELVYQTIRHEKEWEELFIPFLRNWEMDRLAALDAAMIKLALTEFVYCPTVPVKVTINEYVDISKEYSTHKSWEFINGILDRLMKHLKAEGKIQKIGRGLSDN